MRHDKFLLACGSAYTPLGPPRRRAGDAERTADAIRRDATISAGCNGVIQPPSA